MKKIIGIIIVVVVLIVTILVVYVLLIRKPAIKDNTTILETSSSNQASFKNKISNSEANQGSKRSDRMFENNKLGFAFDYSPIHNFWSIRTLDYTDPKDLEKNMYPADELVDVNGHYSEDKPIFFVDIQTAHSAPIALDGSDVPLPNDEFTLEEIKTNSTDANQWIVDWKQNREKQRTWDRIDGLRGETVPEMTTQHVSINGFDAVMYKMSKNLYSVDQGMVILRNGFIFNLVYKGYFPKESHFFSDDQMKEFMTQERAEFNEVAKSFRFI